MIAGEPSALQRNGDGSYTIRVNIVPSYDDEGTQNGWNCHEAQVYVTPTKAALKKALIRSVIDETAEFALVNGYNMHILGIVEDEDAVAAYKAFLQLTEDIGAVVAKILP